MRVITALLTLALAVAQPRWVIERSRLATILFGISFVDEMNGFVPGAQDGLGPIILNTRDGGNSYQRIGHSGSTLMFMAGAAHSATSAAAAGVGILASGVQYTTNGQEYADANVPVGFPPVGSSQSGGAVKGRADFREGAFGFVGSFSEVRGVAFTANGGASWNTFPIPDAPAQARYGSYPTLNTWYVSGGRWPPRNPKVEDPAKTPITEHLTAVVHNDTLRSSFEIEADPSSEKTGYIAYIVKTTDGGRTWQQVYYNEDGAYYFNGIDCADVSNCLAVAEGLNGAYLFGTRNGGATWEQRLFLPGRSSSLFDVKFVNAREAWACGGVMDLSFTGRFYHSLDGGMTWTENLVPGALGTSLTFAPVRGSYHGHATAITLDGQSSTLVYK